MKKEILMKDENVKGKETVLAIFKNDEFGQVRVIMRDGEPWFVAKDVCRVLEIEKHRDAISRLDEDERGSVIVDTPGGRQQMATISESGLYALVFRSRKPEAKAFSKWVRSEILPSIRKTGKYELTAHTPALPDFTNPVEAARAWADEYEAKMLAQKQVALLTETVESQEIALSLHRDWKTVAGIPWLKDYFVSTDHHALGRIGKLLTALCLREGFEVKSIPDDRWGKVNTYPVQAVELLKRTLDEMPSALADIRKL